MVLKDLDVTLFFIFRFTNNKVGYCVKFHPDDDKQHLFVVGTADKKIITWDTRLIFEIILKRICKSTVKPELTTTSEYRPLPTTTTILRSQLDLLKHK
jgi:hypothetical protein